MSTYANMKNFRYSEPSLVYACFQWPLMLYATVRAVLNETLHLFPSAPLTTRASGKVPLVIPAESNNGGPYFHPPRTQIMMVSLWLQHWADIWGSDADEFKPEKQFDRQTLDCVNDNTYMYSPFSHGRRAVSGTSVTISLVDAVSLMIWFDVNFSSSASGRSLLSMNQCSSSCVPFNGSNHFVWRQNSNRKDLCLRKTGRQAPGGSPWRR